MKNLKEKVINEIEEYHIEIAKIKLFIFLIEYKNNKQQQQISCLQIRF